MSRRACVLRAVALGAVLPVVLRSQCAPQWAPGEPLSYLSGSVLASVTWDPDGAGPLPPILVVGGSFTVASFAGTLATHDGSQWSQLGTVPGATVSALGVYNGDLFAASFDAGSTGPSHVWRWNGAAWVAVGSTGSVSGTVNSMASYNGSLVIAGAFATVEGAPMNGIATWNGSAWSWVGPVLQKGVVGTVNALAVFNGELHIAGNLSQAGGVSVSHHAVWNGGALTPGSFFNAPIDTLAVRTGLSASTNYLFAGGSFTTVFNQPSGTVAAQHVARMQQSTTLWSAMGSGISGPTCGRLLVRPGAVLGYELLATSEGSPATVWQWASATSTWTQLGGVTSFGGPLQDITTLLWWNGSYALGQRNATISMRALDASYVWGPLQGQGIAGSVYAQCVFGGDLVIGGGFLQVAGIPANCVARRHLGAWQAMGTNLTGTVRALAVMPNGDLFAGGWFRVAGGPLTAIARWGGGQWAMLQGAFDSSVFALRAMPNGDLIAGGTFSMAGGIAASRVARWNGAVWSPVSGGTSFGSVRALELMPNGDLVAGGDFTQMGGVPASNVARWDGANWWPLDSGLSAPVWALVVHPDGSLFAGGTFTTVPFSPTPFCARWNGTVWQPLTTMSFQPTGNLFALAVLPSGDVVAGGVDWTWAPATPLATRTCLARLHLAGGVATWSSLDVQGDSVETLLTLPDGSLSVGGSFDHTGPQIAGNLGYLMPSCPALATSNGLGCSGRTLTAATLPWVNTTFRAVGSNLPTAAIVLTVTSVSPLPQGLAPLAGVFPQGLPGCDVLVAPDILGALVTTNGIATSQMFLPNTPPLAGVTFFHQMIPIAVDAQGAWTSVTATNALQLTAGFF